MGATLSLFDTTVMMDGAGLCVTELVWEAGRTKVGSPLELIDPTA